ncbi:MAG: hypothetical protein IPJ58_02200 [Ardenticatenia bacterium]|nr:hypothetical protein [Ardenticatenia bacterium]
MTWFKSLFGFEEDRLYTATQGRFAVEGPRLRSLANGRDFAIGSFSTPSLGELRGRARVAGRASRR